MSIFGEFFSPSQETQGTTSTTQNSSFNNQAQSNTQNNAWPELKPFLNTVSNTVYNTAPFNANQTDAAARQNALPNNLIPSFGASSNIASNGFASQIPAFNNQYNEQVIRNLQSDFARQNAEASDADSAMRAKNMSLGNRTGAEALVSRGAQDAQAKALVAARQQGFNTSAGLAAQDAGLRLQGAGTTGNLTGAATGANQSGFGMGQTLWENPTKQYATAATAISPFLQAAGQNTSSSQSGSSIGSSTGLTNSLAQQNPADAQTLGFLGGAAIKAAPMIMGMFSDERVKDNIAPIGETFDGQPIYRFNYKGQPQTQIGLIAQDVERSNPDAVGSVGGVKTVNYDAATARAAGKGHFADGGGVGAIQPYHSNIHSKFADAFEAISGIKQRYSGGAVQKFDGGGSAWNTSVSSFDPSSTMGDDVVGQAKSNQFGMDAKAFGDYLSEGGDNKDGGGDKSKDFSGAHQNAMNALNNQAQGLSAFMVQNRPQPIQGFEGGGVADWNPDGPVPFAAPSDGGSQPSFLGGAPSWKSSAPAMSPITPYAGNSSLPSGAVPDAKPSSGGGFMQGFKDFADWKDTPTDNLARSLFAFSGPLLGGPVAQQAGEMVKERLAQQNADRMHQQMIAQMTGRLPDGQQTAAERHWQATHDTTEAYRKAQIDKLDPAYGIKRSVEARKELAPTFGLKEGSPEYMDFVGTGKMPILKTQAAVDYAARYDAAKAYGGEDWVNSEHGRDYVLTGKVPADKAPRAETMFDTEIAKKSAADLEKRTDAVREGQSKIQKLDQLEQIVNNPDVYQGKGAIVVNELKKWGTAAGFPISGVADSEVMNSLSNQLALALRSTAGGEGMPGALSDADRKFLQSSVPGLTNTRQGNQAMVYMMRKAEDYKVKANTEAMNYIAQQRTNVGLPEYMTKWMRSNPMFTEDDRKRVSTMTGQRFDDLVPGRSAPATDGAPKADPLGIR